MRFCFGLFVSVLLFFSLCTPSWAITLSFNSSTSTIGVGDTIDVDVVISGMQGAYLGGFDMNVNFDDTNLSLENYSLGSELGDIALFEADDWSNGYIGGGVLHLSELSWLWDLSFQPDEFTLATISFSGISAGASELILSDVILSDDWGYGLQADLISESVDVAAPVPEPATMLLLGTGLIGLVGAKRRTKK